MSETVKINPNFVPRDYQRRIVADVARRNALIVLPTGLGKTAISAMLIRNALIDGGLALFLTPTKPLAEQQAAAIRDFFADSVKVKIATGETTPEKRSELWNDFQVMVCTPQTAFNDLSSMGSVRDKFGIVVFDEAHRAAGDYPYVTLRKLFSINPGIQFVGLTASPGDEEHESEIMINLGLEITVRGDYSDSQVRKYTHDVGIETIRLRRTRTMESIRILLDSIYSNLVGELKALEITGISARKDLLKGIKSASAMIEAGNTAGYAIMNLLVTSLRVDYAREYAETQGFEQVSSYIHDMLNDETPSVRKSIAKLTSMQEMKQLLGILDNPLSDRTNPKLISICRLCSDQVATSRVIVFAHYRNTGELITSYLNSNCEGVVAKAFYGQGPRAGGKGMTQKEQTATIDAFRKGEFNVLVATSVGEEGLDIPDTDLIIFYEPVPSQIRTIQRRGRTGRFRPGSVKILMYQDGREVPYYFMSMKSISNSGKSHPRKKKRVSLDDFGER